MNIAKRNCKAKDPNNCRYHRTGLFNVLNMQPTLIEKHGVDVIEGKIAVSDFARSFNTIQGTNSYYEGSWDQLVTLVARNWKNQEPGTGSVNGDVLLVNVPPANFRTSIVKVDRTNEHLLQEVDHVRIEGEKPVSMKVIEGKKQPASYVQVVVYRADVLAQDDDRSSDAEWEIIAINAQIDKVTPMHPTMMWRNANNEEGGTLRSYTDKEWADAEEYWSTHAYVKE